jgi:BA14K-like protein
MFCRVAIDDAAMSTLRNLMATATILASLGAAPLFAADTAVSRPASTQPLALSGPSGNTWFYDGRDDTRDFPTNGFFPGDFAADPFGAAFGATGLFGGLFASTPSSVSPVAVESQRDQTYCARHHRSYDRASGTFLGHDSLRHRC